MNQIDYKIKAVDILIEKREKLKQTKNEEEQNMLLAQISVLEEVIW